MNTLLFIIGLFVVTVTAPLIVELFLVTVGSLLSQKETLRKTDKAVRLAVIVPAHNEEHSISRCVQSLYDSAPSGTRIFVIAHNCSDSTAALAHFAGAETLIYNDSATNGKAHALRFGFEHAARHNAEAVLVVDADSVVSANLIPAILDAFSMGAEAVQCRYEMQGQPGKFKSQLVSLAVRGFNFIRPSGRQRLGFSAGILGNGFALSTRLLKDVPYDAMSVVEDLEYHLHLILAGKQVYFLDSAVVTAELPSSGKGETTQHSRWQGGRLRVARMWAPRLFREVFRGRFAAVEPLLDLAGLPIAFEVLLLLIAACLPLFWVRLYVVLAFFVILGHVFRAVWAGPQRIRTLRALMLSPFYLLWKICLVPNILRASRSEAAWVRTDRGIAARNAQ